MKKPKCYKLPNLKSCLSAVEHMGFDEEGFVVVDKYWKRVKIKSPAYVAAHYLRNNGVNSKARILEIIENNEQEEFLTYFPEYKEYFDDIENKLNEYKEKLTEAIWDINFKMVHNDPTLSWGRKDFANYINEKYPEYSTLLFKFMDSNLVKMFVDVEWSKLTKEKKMQKLNLKYNKEEEK